MSRLLIRLVINAAALAAAAYIVPGIGFDREVGGVEITSLLIVALIFGLVNALIKPVVQLITCPAYVLTLGLFTFIVNAAMLLLTSAIANAVGSRFAVDGFLAALLGGVVISIVSTLLSLFLGGDEH